MPDPNPPTPDTPAEPQRCAHGRTAYEPCGDCVNEEMGDEHSQDEWASLRRELDSVAAERDAALAALEAEHREVERLREALRGRETVNVPWVIE